MNLSRRGALLGAAASLMLVSPSHAASPAEEANKELLRRYVEDVYNARNVTALDDIAAPDFTQENQDDLPGVEALKARVTANIDLLSSIVPDYTFVIEHTVAEQAFVAMRGTITATNKGTRVVAKFFMHARCNDGRIKTTWSLFDLASLLGD